MGQPNSKLYKKQILQWMEVIDCEQEINYDWPCIQSLHRKIYMQISTSLKAERRLGITKKKKLTKTKTKQNKKHFFLKSNSFLVNSILSWIQLIIRTVVSNNQHWKLLLIMHMLQLWFIFTKLLCHHFFYKSKPIYCGV